MESVISIRSIILRDFCANDKSVQNLNEFLTSLILVSAYLMFHITFRFANYGNTCYLNSVVQSLFGLLPFVEDLQLVSAQLNLPSTSLSSGLIQVIAARMKGQVAGVKQSLK